MKLLSNTWNGYTRLKWTKAETTSYLLRRFSEKTKIAYPFFEKRLRKAKHQSVMRFFEIRLKNVLISTAPKSPTSLNTPHTWMHYDMCLKTYSSSIAIMAKIITKNSSKHSIKAWSKAHTDISTEHLT